MKPVLIAEAPSVSAVKPPTPLFPFPMGSPGARLWRMSGLSRGEYMKAFHCINLSVMAYPQPEQQRWAAWNLIGSRLLDGRAVVLLGWRVWLAFGGRQDADPLIWYTPSVPAFRPACVCFFPAPVKQTHWYDDEHQAGAATNFMRLLAEGDYPDWSEE